MGWVRCGQRRGSWLGFLLPVPGQLVHEYSFRRPVLVFSGGELCEELWQQSIGRVHGSCFVGVTAGYLSWGVTGHVA